MPSKESKSAISSEKTNPPLPPQPTAGPDSEEARQPRTRKKPQRPPHQKPKGVNDKGERTKSVTPKEGRFAAPAKVQARKKAVFNVSKVSLDEVKSLALLGKTIREIAHHLGCSEDTVQRHWSEVIQEGHATWIKINGNVVRQYAGYGCTLEEIAAVLDVSEDIVERHFAESLRTGQARLNAAIRKAQLQILQSGAAGAGQVAIWMGKSMLGQRDPDKVEAIQAQRERLLQTEAPQEEGSRMDAQAKKDAFNHDDYGALLEAMLTGARKDVNEEPKDGGN